MQIPYLASMAEVNPVKQLIKHVGRGKTLARDLSPAQAEEALARILRGEFSPAQLGAFLQALRIKETNAQELIHASLGCAPFFVDLSSFPLEPAAEEFPLVINLGFDTARKGGVVSLLAAALLRRAQLAKPLVMWEPAINFVEPHSMEFTRTVLRSHAWLAEGVCPEVAVQELCPPWKDLREVREQIGFRSILNTLEKILRPWSTSPVVVGISHDTFSERLCHVLYGLGAPRGAVIQGNHGTCDLKLGEKPTEITVWNREDVRDTLVETHNLGLALDPEVHLVSKMAEWSTWIHHGDSPLWAAVRLQAGYLLHVASGAPLEDSLQRVLALEIPTGV
jgi:anthranilate phosphoribosyltransferase